MLLQKSKLTENKPHNRIFPIVADLNHALNPAGHFKIMKKILCKLKSCKRAKTCKQKDDPFKDGKLCWGYENYINQDIPKNIKQYEVLFSEININLDRIQAKIFEPVYLNKRNEIIKMFFFGRVSVGDISEHLQCSPQYIYSVLKICRNKLLKDVVEP